ncbi:hypothetical protein HY214_00835 [Candidatus Roizmanbacteria bacterium]|nr:hypothetical protein [Candidatus Roizmanbacteria bacterium]
MNGSFLFGISLTASFLAGILALFAPCCITFLFPSYLGTIFKERTKVTLYTILFSLGLSFVLIPIAFGFRLFVFILNDYHKQVYYSGGLILVLMGISTLKPFFHFPQIFHIKPRLDQKLTAGSAFGLGVMSGLTSACCAPVLFAAVTLTTLSPTLIQALIVSIAYVLGIVFPLFLLSLSYEKMTAKISGSNRQKVYGVFKLLGAGIFILSGIAVLIFNYQNKIEMNQMEGYSKSIRLIVFNLAKNFQNPFLDIGTFLILVFIFYKLLRIGKKS